MVNITELQLPVTMCHFSLADLIENLWLSDFWLDKNKTF